MGSIVNDQELRAALVGLDSETQRRLGCQFAERVVHLCQDERVHRAIASGLDTSATDSELEDAFRAAKAYAAHSYTDCGKDTDWMAQAAHFVAEAAAAALTPEALLAETQNRAWKAAVHARMALNCAMMEDDSASEQKEPAQQYALAQAALG